MLIRVPGTGSTTVRYVNVAHLNEINVAGTAGQTNWGVSASFSQGLAGATFAAGLSQGDAEALGEHIATALGIDWQA